MNNKKIAVLVVAAALSMGSLTAAAHGNDSHGTGYERLDHNQIFNFGRWLAFDNIFVDSTDAGYSYDGEDLLAGSLVHKVDYDTFMTSSFAVKPL